VYLGVGSLDTALERAQGAGGKVALPKTQLPEGMGAYAHIVDSEGNRVGLHAMA
jgi:predicted enzyme related to lactoylglutathione lyase